VTSRHSQHQQDEHRDDNEGNRRTFRSLLLAALGHPALLHCRPTEPECDPQPDLLRVRISQQGVIQGLLSSAGGAGCPRF